MGISWEFILGLFLPAYAAGHIWLIKVAREDTDLYKLVRYQIKKLCLSAIFAILVAAFGYAKFVVGTQIAMDFALTIVLMLTLPLCVTLTSLPFFDRVAALPPKPKEPKESRQEHGEE